MMNEGALHELPGGWVWTRLGDIAEKINPGFPSGKHNMESQGVPHLRPMNINVKGEIDFSEVKYVQLNSYDSLLKGDVLFNNTNSPELLGKTSYIKDDTNWAYSNHMTRIRLNSSFLNSAWISYYLHSLFLKGFFKISCTHHVNQASINSTFLSQKVPIPLPPLPEQRAIVSKIEQLFSDLDNGIESFKKAQAQLKLYRQSVLKAACEGKLVPTEAELARAEGRDYEAADVLLERISEEYKKSTKVRKNKEMPFLKNLTMIPDGWVQINFSMLIDKIKRGPSKKCNQEGRGIRYITSGNLQEGKVRLDFDYKFLESFDSIDSCRLLPNDLILNCVNSLEQIGKSAIFKSQHGEAIVGFNNYALELRTNFINSHYANLFCQTEICKKQIYFLIKRAVNQVSFATRELDFISVPLPPLAEQRRIVAEVERRLTISDKMEATITESLQKAESLRQSILKKAFEGKLLNEKELEKIRNAPDWEPAEKLLERIRQEKEIKEKNNKPAKRKSKE